MSTSPIAQTATIVAVETIEQTARKEFEGRWSPSKSAALDPSRVQLPEHAPRAWERTACPPTLEHSRFKQVWKCNGGRFQFSSTSQLSTMDLAEVQQSHKSDGQSSSRSIKRLKIKSVKTGELTMNLAENQNDQILEYVTTSWEDRDEMLPRKQLHASTCIQSEESIQHVETKRDSMSNINYKSSDEIEQSSEDNDKSTSTERQAPRDETLQQDTEHIQTSEATDNVAYISIESEEAEDIWSNTDELESVHDLQNLTNEQSIRTEESTMSDQLVDEESGRTVENATLKQVDGTVSPRTSSTPPSGVETSSSPSRTSHLAEAVSDEHAIEEPSYHAEDIPIAAIVETTSIADSDISPDAVQETSQPQLLEDISSVSDGCVQDRHMHDNTATLPSHSPEMEPEHSPDRRTDASSGETTNMTLTSQHYLDEEKAYLESFLNRAAASKASKVIAVSEDDTSCTQVEAVRNRRDSDAIRQALASPGRLPLEDKDGNAFSPVKADQSLRYLSSPLTNSSESIAELKPELILPPIHDLLAKDALQPRRSIRSRVARPPYATSPLSVQPHQFLLRRGDATETLTFNISKTETQLTAQETRKNTRKNKGAAISVVDRLVKWKAELAVLGKDGLTPEPRVNRPETKGVRWSESLEFLNEATGKPETAPLVNNEQQPIAERDVLLLVPIEADQVPPLAAGKKQSSRSTRSSTSKIRRLNGPTAVHGTSSKTVVSNTIKSIEVEEPSTTLVEADIVVSVDDAKSRTTTLASTSGRIYQAACIETASSIPELKLSVNSSKLPAPRKLSLNPSSKSVTTTAVGAGEAGNQLRASKIRAPTRLSSTSMLPVVGNKAKRAAVGKD